MTRHSKNNTASAVFTSAERSRLDYGTQHARAGKDSFRSFDACHLCLHTVKEPVCCEKGHLYCRACIVDSMLAQMDANKERQAEYEAWLESRKRTEAGKEKADVDAKTSRFLEEQNALMKGGQEPAAKKNKIASYWLPSSTPTASTSFEAMNPPENKIYCSADPKKKHTVSLKKLQTIVFSTVDGNPACPVCRNPLKNGLEMLVAVPCGHVFCRSCCVCGLQKEICQVCDMAVEKCVELSKAGTGFVSGGGNVLVTKYDVAFQC